MRRAFAHDAVLAMAQGEDIRAPGAAITLELCGALEHDPPCPLAPHHTHAERDGEEVRLRILFATAPESEKSVRERIDSALAAWQVRSSRASALHDEERAHADRLAAT